MRFLVDQQGGRGALVEATRSPDPAVRLAAVALAVRRGALGGDVVPVLRDAIGDADPRLARWAAIEITSSRLTPETRAELLPLLLGHRDASLRRRAVLACARTPGAEAHIERALLDPRAVVCAAAREKLRDGRSRALYQRTLTAAGATRREVLGAISGLAEVGLAEDAPLVLPWITADHPPVEAEAVRCLSLLAPEAHRALFEARLHSPWGRVRREAERALARAG